MTGQDSLFDDGAKLAEIADIVEAPVAPEARVEFLAGMLSYWSLGREAKRDERTAFIEAARAALADERFTGDLSAGDGEAGISRRGVTASVRIADTEWDDHVRVSCHLDPPPPGIDGEAYSITMRVPKEPS